VIVASVAMLAGFDAYHIDGINPAARVARCT